MQPIVTTGFSYNPIGVLVIVVISAYFWNTRAVCALTVKCSTLQIHHHLILLT